MIIIIDPIIHTVTISKQIKRKIKNRKFNHPQDQLIIQNETTKAASPPPLLGL